MLHIYEVSYSHTDEHPMDFGWLRESVRKAGGLWNGSVFPTGIPFFYVRAHENIEEALRAILTSGEKGKCILSVHEEGKLHLCDEAALGETIKHFITAPEKE